MSDKPACGCHGEPMYWFTDPRRKAGGHWYCAVKKREMSRRVDRARRELKTQRQRERYDNDAVYRIEKKLADHRRDRLETIKRRKEATRGALQG